MLFINQNYKILGRNILNRKDVRYKEVKNEYAYVAYDRAVRFIENGDERYSYAINLLLMYSASCLHRKASILLAEVDPNKLDFANFAYDLFKQYAEKGDALSQFFIAQEYNIGEFLKKDYIKSLYWAQEAAKADVPEAFFMLGVSHQYGYGVNRDYQKAMYWYQRAEKFNQPNAINNIGFLYDNGLGVKKNKSRANRYYTKANNKKLASVSDVNLKIYNILKPLVLVMFILGIITLNLFRIDTFSMRGSEELTANELIFFLSTILGGCLFTIACLFAYKRKLNYIMGIIITLSLGVACWTSINSYYYIVYAVDISIAVIYTLLCFGLYKRR